MVYTFRSLGHYFALDVESGSIFQINKLTKKLIDRRKSPLKKEDFLGRLPFFKSQRRKIQAQIDELTAQGILFSPYVKENISPSKQQIVKALCLNISHACSLNCTYCFAGGGAYDGSYGSNNEKSTQTPHMSIDTAKAGIDFLIAKSGKRRNLEVDFFGGEPLLNLQTVIETVKYAREQEKKHSKNFRFTITTNGLNLTQDIIDFFNKEMDNVVISIDGRKKVHDGVRPKKNGSGSYDEVVLNAQRFKEQRGDKSYYIRGTFTKNNLDFSRDCLHLNDLGFDQISLEPVVLPQNNPLSLNFKDIKRIENEYERLARAYLQRRLTKKWFSFFHFNMDFEGGPCVKKRLVGCGAGGEYLAVSTDGSLYPCHRFDGNNQYLIGNVFNLEQLNEKVTDIFRASNVTTKNKCNDCFCKYMCSGGCGANSIEFEGDINTCHELSCRLMRKRAELSMAIYALERSKK